MLTQVVDDRWNVHHGSTIRDLRWRLLRKVAAALISGSYYRLPNSFEPDDAAIEHRVKI